VTPGVSNELGGFFCRSFFQKENKRKRKRKGKKKKRNRKRKKRKAGFVACLAHSPSLSTHIYMRNFVVC